MPPRPAGARTPAGASVAGQSEEQGDGAGAAGGAAEGGSGVGPGKEEEVEEEAEVIEEFPLPELYVPGRIVHIYRQD